MKARMNHPAYVVPGAMDALQALSVAANKGGVPLRTQELVQLRASQINGCSVCVDMHARDLARHGEKPERIYAVAAWRDSPHFHRRRARRARARGVRDAPERLSRSGARRRLGRRGGALRRSGVGLAARFDRLDQRLESSQRRDRASRGRPRRLTFTTKRGRGVDCRGLVSLYCSGTGQSHMLMPPG